MNLLSLPRTCKQPNQTRSGMWCLRAPAGARMRMPMVLIGIRDLAKGRISSTAVFGSQCLLRHPEITSAHLWRFGGRSSPPVEPIPLMRIWCMGSEGELGAEVEVEGARGRLTSLLVRVEGELAPTRSCYSPKRRLERAKRLPLGRSGMEALPASMRGPQGPRPVWAPYLPLQGAVAGVRRIARPMAMEHLEARQGRATLQFRASMAKGDRILASCPVVFRL